MPSGLNPTAWKVLCVLTQVATISGIFRETRWQRLLCEAFLNVIGTAVATLSAKCMPSTAWDAEHILSRNQKCAERLCNC